MVSAIKNLGDQDCHAAAFQTPMKQQQTFTRLFAKPLGLDASRKEMAPMKATTLLTEDHKLICRALDVLAQMSERTSRKGSFDVADAQDLLDFLKQFADRHHQGKEEGVFFPSLLRDRNQRNYPSLCTLVFEHNRERSLVEGLEEALRTRKPKDFIFYADRLVEVLRTHVRKEEDELFTLADSTLDSTQDERVALEMRNHERSWLETELPRLLQRLAELENAYQVNTNAQRVANR